MGATRRTLLPEPPSWAQRPGGAPSRPAPLAGPAGSQRGPAAPVKAAAPTASDRLTSLWIKPQAPSTLVVAGISRIPAASGPGRTPPPPSPLPPPLPTPLHVLSTCRRPSRILEPAPRTPPTPPGGSVRDVGGGPGRERPHTGRRECGTKGGQGRAEGARGAAALLKQSKFAYLNREYHAIRQV